MPKVNVITFHVICYRYRYRTKATSAGSSLAVSLTVAQEKSRA